MNKKMMLLGFCMLSAFSAVQADEPEVQTVDTTVAIVESTTIAAPTDAECVNEKDKGDCGCKR